MSVTTKAKINLKEGAIELEGSETFVSKQLEAFQKQMQTVKLPNPQEDIKKENDIGKSEKLLSKKKVVKISPCITPIPLELKAKDGKPALRDFFNEKKPKSQQEDLTVFAYYLKHHLNINDMLSGHVASCCKEVGRKVPKSMNSTFKSIQHYKEWLDVGVGAESAQITTTGENFVEYELPREKDASTNKTTT